MSKKCFSDATSDSDANDVGNSGSFSWRIFFIRLYVLPTTESGHGHNFACLPIFPYVRFVFAYLSVGPSCDIQYFETKPKAEVSCPSPYNRVEGSVWGAGSIEGNHGMRYQMIWFFGIIADHYKRQSWIGFPKPNIY